MAKTTTGRNRTDPTDDVRLTRLADNGPLNGGVSHWLQQLGLPTERDPLPGDRQVDVAIVGAGMTGLWTAYYLKKADPALRIAVVERRFAGYGASGRNGGWLSAESPGLLRHYQRDGGAAAARALQQQMFGTVDEVLRALSAEAIQADAVKDGLVYVATNTAQRQRLRARFDGLAKQGWPASDLEWLDAEGVTDKHVRVDGAIASYWTPHCARVDPAKLTLGLAQVVEDLGVVIYEGTTATEIQDRRVITDRGVLRADTVVQALEGYTGSLRGERRTMLPMNSSIVVTEPLEAGVWNEIGWQGAQLVGDWAIATPTCSAPPTDASPLVAAASRTTMPHGSTCPGRPRQRR